MNTLNRLSRPHAKKGYTETIFGRRRYFPGLKSPNRAVRDAAERAALNALSKARRRTS